MNVEVVVPYLAGPGRARLLGHILGRYRTHHPDWALTVAPCPAGPWSKGAAARPALAASEADVVVLADADSWTEPWLLANAVRAARKQGWVVPFTTVRRITRGDTDRILAGQTIAWPDIEAVAPACPGGGIVVARRGTWQAVHGPDPRFTGWGGEDRALGYALDALAGAPTNIPGVLWHLWHPGQRTISRATRRRWRAYRAARHDPAAMAALVNGRT